MFDWELFLKICKDYNVPLSSDYKVPMLEEDGVLKELTPSDVQRALLPASKVFAYMEKPYSFKECISEEVELIADDLLAA